MYKMLFIDDDKEILRAYRDLFHENDNDDSLAPFMIILNLPPEIKKGPEFDCSFASSGEEGVEMAQKAVSCGENFHVAFVDMRMHPGIGGADTIRALRKIDNNLLIVIVSAYGNVRPDELKDLVNEPDEFIHIYKPFDPEEIFQIAVVMASLWKYKRLYEMQLIANNS